MEGWVKLHRKFISWEWFTTPDMVHLFVYLLLMANREDNSWQGFQVKRGQLITGRKKLSEQTGISERRIRTCLQRLQNTGELTSKTTSKYSIITICNYDDYQSKQTTSDQQNVQPPTSNRPAIDHKQEGKESKEDIKKDIKGREVDFKEEVESFVDKYDIDLLTNFFIHWSEPNPQKTKMRKEMEKTWDTSRRLAKWKNNKELWKK